MAVTRTSSRAAHRELLPRRDERLALYTAVAIGALVLGVLDGGLRLVVVGVPFAIAVVLGTRHRAPAPVAIEVTLASDRIVEGDDIPGRIDVLAPPEYDIELAVARATDGVGPQGDHPWAWSIPVGVERPVGVELALVAHRWGRFCPGDLEIRLVSPGSLLVRQATMCPLPEITVLPAPRRIDRLLRIDRPRVAAGAHPTRTRWSGGYDFAEVRDYQPGDRLRDLNWSATMRRQEPAVNQRLPERAGDVVVVLDTFPDALRRHSEIARDAIVAAGRIAWSIAREHLAANDRVGVVVEGSRAVWLSPQSGRRAPYTIFAALLQATASSADAAPSGFVREHAQVPAGASVVAISPLARPATVDRLVALRGRGHRVDVVAIDVGPTTRRRLPSLPDPIARIRDLVFEEQVASLRRHGVQVVVAGGTDDEAAALHALGRAQHRMRSRR